MAIDAPARPRDARRRLGSAGASPRVVIAATTILAAYLATRLSFVDRFPYFLDEGTYAVFTHQAAQSLDDLFVSFSIGREPLMFWLGIPWEKVGFNPLDAVRLVSVVSGLLTVLVVGLLGRRLGGSLVGWAAAALCVALPFFLVHDGIGIIEPLVTLIMAGALLLQIELARRPDLRVAALLGLVLAAGVLTKENTKPALALIPVSLLCFDWSPGGRRRRMRVWLAGIGIAAVMVIAAQLLLRSSSRYDQYEASREDPLLYTVRSLGDVLGDPFAGVGNAWSAYHPAFTGYVTIPLIAAAVVGAGLAWRRRRALTAVLLAWIALPFAVSMLFSTAPFPRHVMYLLPPAVPLMAYALVEGARWAQRKLPRAEAVVVSSFALLVLLAPALRLDARVLDDPASARYPGVDDVQYVTGTGAGTVWPGMADTIRRRARGERVLMLSPTAYTQVLEMLLGPDPRYQVVEGTSPKARRAQFAITDEIPFLDATAARIMREEKFVPLERYRRPRDGAVATLLERPPPPGAGAGGDDRVRSR